MKLVPYVHFKSCHPLFCRWPGCWGKTGDIMSKMSIVLASTKQTWQPQELSLLTDDPIFCLWCSSHVKRWLNNIAILPCIRLPASTAAVMWKVAEQMILPCQPTLLAMTLVKRGISLLLSLLCKLYAPKTLGHHAPPTQRKYKPASFCD